MTGTVQHCADNTLDRSEGGWWELAFGRMAVAHGRTFTAHQAHTLNRAAACSISSTQVWLLPDVTIWTSPGEHHEIKHKNAITLHDVPHYGLEQYRFDALLQFRFETRTPVFYTIHDWELAAAAGRLRHRDDPSARVNDIADWRTAEVVALEHTVCCRFPGKSYVNGRARTVEILYWPVSLWMSLADVWRRSLVAWTVRNRATHRHVQSPHSPAFRWWEEKLD